MSARTSMLGLAEAAQRLGIPYQRAHRLLMVGVLPGRKRGGRWSVLAASVHRLRKSRRVRRLAPNHNPEVSDATQ